MLPVMWRPCHESLSSNTFPDADVQRTGWEAYGNFSSFHLESDDRSNTGVQKHTMKSVVPTSDCGLGFDLMSSRSIPLYQRPVSPSSTRHPAGGPILAKYLRLPSRKTAIAVPIVFLERELYLLQGGSCQPDKKGPISKRSMEEAASGAAKGAVKMLMNRGLDFRSPIATLATSSFLQG
jgi:hypothetical protein